MVGRIATAAILTVVPVLAAFAGDAEDCADAGALLQTDPGRAVAACRRLAEQGNADAQYRLGAMYNFGQGVLQDSVRASLWFRKAADQGIAGAQYNLGVMYDRGQGVEPDHAAALMWYRRAAAQGMAAAAYNLALSYAAGEGVPQDYRIAADLYRQAAEQGFAAGQLNLGALYDAGHGVPQDYVQAYVWYSLAVAGFPAGDDRDLAARDRDRLAGKMPPAEIARAQALAAAWRRKAAE